MGKSDDLSSEKPPAYPGARDPSRRQVTLALITELSNEMNAAPDNWFIQNQIGIYGFFLCRDPRMCLGRLRILDAMEAFREAHGVDEVYPCIPLAHGNVGIEVEPMARMCGRTKSSTRWSHNNITMSPESRQLLGKSHIPWGSHHDEIGSYYKAEHYDIACWMWHTLIWERTLHSSSVALSIPESYFQEKARQVFEQRWTEKHKLRRNVERAKFKHGETSDELWPWANFMAPSPLFELVGGDRLTDARLRDAGLKRTRSRYLKSPCRMHKF